VSDERYRRISELAYFVSKLPESEREAFLERECPDADMREEVLSLVRFMLDTNDATPFIVDPPRVAEPLSAGQRIGPYEIVREIGRGGMGVVYLAKDVTLGSPVALKVMHAAIAWDENQRARFLREAQIVRSLSHPGIVTVFQFHDFDGVLCIASEYVDGMNLRTRLAGGALSLKEAAQIGIKIAEVLTAAAARDIVHRDLKPENVMCTTDGRVKVLDFGLAKNVDAVASATNHQWSTSLTSRHVIVGTPAYMAPEQLKGAAVDTRTDLFALGTILYELASGNHPFDAGDPSETAARILIHDPKPLTENRRLRGARLDAIVRKCLAKEPSVRYQSATELHGDLEKFVAIRDDDEPAPAAGPDHRQWWRVHQYAITAIYAVIATAAWRATAMGFIESPFIYAVAICAAAAGGSARMHLIFVERTNASKTADEIARIGGFIKYADWLFTLLFAGSAALLVVGMHQLVAATVVASAIMFTYAFLVIEPATTRKAFPRRSSGVRRKRTPAPRRAGATDARLN
jgi:serine/threonine protein kinase